MTVRAYEVTVVDTDWHKAINAVSAGQAKAEYYRDLRDSWPDIPFTALRVRCVGRPRTSPDFIRCAEYRGVSFRCGDAVSVDGDPGVIVGHNSSANFDVLFEGGRYKGQRLNVHPASIQLRQRLTQDGE